MTHPFSSPADVQTRVAGNALELDFSQMPLYKLVNIHQACEGPSAEERGSWPAAASCAIEAMYRCLSETPGLLILLDDESPYLIVVRVRVAVADSISQQVQPIIDLFGNVGVHIERPNTIRSSPAALSA